RGSRNIQVILMSPNAITIIISAMLEPTTRRNSKPECTCPRQRRDVAPDRIGVSIAHTSRILTPLCRALRAGPGRTDIVVFGFARTPRARDRRIGSIRGDVRQKLGRAHVLRAVVCVETLAVTAVRNPLADRTRETHLLVFAQRLVTVTYLAAAA